MKKIILDEGQLQKLIHSIIKEQDESELSIETEYKIKTKKIYFNFVNLHYENNKITNVKTNNFIINFNLNIEQDISGIKSIKVTDITGPDSIPLTIEYGDNINQLDVNLNWDPEYIHKEYEEIDTIGVHNDISIFLSNNQNGDIICNGMTIYVREI